MIMTAPLIGISGKARAGKDTLAQLIIEQSSIQFTRLAFADAVVERVCLAYPDVDRLIRVHGYEQAKDTSPRVRQLLQVVGMQERGRDPDVWIRPVMRRAKKLREQGIGVVISDVRFRNEVRAIERDGGFVVRIYRPNDEGQYINHISETELDDYPFSITIETRAISDLYQSVPGILAVSQGVRDEC